ncbi:hypothetical protein AwDysgo_20170 [Bacteroidales bacterium]|nr:hypothetical protein AwDysgo_20170 [Bacteroidales bacterium]
MNQFIVKLTIFCWLLSIATLKAQTFKSQHLEYLGGLLQGKCTLPKTTKYFSCNAINMPIHVEYNSSGEIEHLGLVIFSQDIKNNLGKTIANFQERLFLEVLLQKNDENAKMLLTEYKIEVLLQNPLPGTAPFMREIEKSLKFASEQAHEYVLTKDSLYWTSTWHNEHSDFSLRFPANYDLILGMDKKELEDKFEIDLLNSDCKINEQDVIVVNLANLIEIKKGVFEKVGKDLFVKKMNASTFFMQNEMGGAQLIYNTKLPIESISNILLHLNEKSKNIYLDIFHKTYGSNVKKYEVELYQLLCYFKDKYETFVGIEYFSAESIKLSVIFRSLEYNCIHLLYIETKPENIFNKKENWTSTLYTYIPNQNIKNIYKEFSKNKIDINF